MNDTAGISFSPRTDVTASPTSPSILPSQVEETLAACPRFRILLLGKGGVGKSSFFSYFTMNFRVPEHEIAIDIAHDHFGISRAYYFDQNPRFIFHEIGFELGIIEGREILKFFLRDRAECSAKLADQVHAIWLFIETPRRGARLLYTEDEGLLELAKKLKIPVILILTKYDLLVIEHYRSCNPKLSAAERKVEAVKRAKIALKEVTKNLEVPFAPVSTKREARKEYGEKMLEELMQVTQDNLVDTKGSLRALWATAQQINARQKVELSISEGLKSKFDHYYLIMTTLSVIAGYWRDLDDSIFFRGHRLIDCISRIHDDLLIIWNLNDPSQILSGKEFFKGMMELVEPLSEEVIRNQRADGIVANKVSIAGGYDSNLALPAIGAIIEIEEFQFLRSKYQKGVSTAIYLAAYIVDLTLILFVIFTVVAANPPKSLSLDFVMNTQARYKSRSSLIHAQVKEAAFSFKLEEKIGSLIWSELVSTFESVS